MKEIHVHELPTCNITGCEEPAPYDCKTIMGFWGNLCESHYSAYGTPIGSKRKLIEKMDGVKTDKIPTVTFELTREIVFDEEYASVECPHCGTPRDVETDARYTVKCEGCGNQYRVMSPI